MWISGIQLQGSSPTLTKTRQSVSGTSIQFSVMFRHVCSRARILATCIRTQHRLPTSLSIVECYVLRPFAHPVKCCVFLGAGAPSLKPVKLQSQQLPTIFCCVIAEEQRSNVGSVCTPQTTRTHFPEYEKLYCPASLHIYLLSLQNWWTLPIEQS